MQWQKWGVGQCSHYHTGSMDTAPGAATEPGQRGLQRPPWRLAFLWSPASEQLPTAPATDPVSSVKMLLGSAAARGVGIRLDM